METPEIRDSKNELQNTDADGDVNRKEMERTVILVAQHQRLGVYMLYSGVFGWR